MKRENALRHLLLERKHDAATRISRKYGTTDLNRAIAAWKIAMILSNDNEGKITGKVLDEVIVLVESGDDVVGHLLDGDEDLLSLLKKKDDS